MVSLHIPFYMTVSNLISIIMLPLNTIRQLNEITWTSLKSGHQISSHCGDPFRQHAGSQQPTIIMRKGLPNVQCPHRRGMSPQRDMTSSPAYLITSGSTKRTISAWPVVLHLCLILPISLPVDKTQRRQPICPIRPQRT
ncbi:hypothetical protein KC365_g42 [Hortaea werneckii]|nr:hypothetical protein KC365_g42 [Hortaea werneckii]